VAYTPADFALLVEVVSPTSTGMDRVLKPAEYAAAGIPFFWRVEIEPAVEVISYELSDGAYRETVRATEGSVAMPAPYPVVIDVPALSVP
jgi:Uma2 family endonuclease